jgi:glycerophosphoryl diester phosphodiesterase
MTQVGHMILAGDGEPGPAVLAHRGGAGPWSENTLEAFAGGLASGADGVELDVRRSADGVAVVHHDARVPAGEISELAAADLPGYVPTLAEALDRCAGAVVNVEIKNSPLEAGFDALETIAADVAEVLAATEGSGAGPRLVVVSSFSPATVQAMRLAAPHVALGLLVHPALDADGGLEVAAGLGCAALHPHLSQVTGALVAKAHGLGMAVVTWTVNAPEELAAVLAAGVDALITDHVADVRGHLGRR